MHRLARMMLEKAPAVAEYLRAMVRTEQEQRWFKLGLSLSHFEEALARGETLRAEAHAKASADLIDQIKAASSGLTATQTKGCTCGRRH